MKLPFTIYDLRFTIVKQSGGAVSPLTAAGAHGVTRPTAFNRKASIVNHKSQRGVALIITLILLSVTLVMALAFLALSGRERGSVTTQTDTATARLAADAGQSFAEAQIAANILASTNPYAFGLIVSTNYQPAAAPVWLSNTVTRVMENRFYLDLNRNGVDDPNGFVAEINNAGASTSNTVFEVGDPEWIGVLEHPDQPYGPNNLYIARFAFMAQPAGNSLDLNAIHNQALSPARRPLTLGSIAPDYYFRNQGVGSWELNLPAFLTDLNTNEWDPSTDAYNYLQPNFNNTGRGFEDAFPLLTNRYAGAYATLPSVTALYGQAGAVAFRNDNLDGYSDGPLMTGSQLPADNDNVTYFWAGANNTNHYFTPEELFNTNETAGFGFHLLDAGTNYFGGKTNSTYDRYTFYRMLSQLGTDTTPESGKMNLNYDNLDPGSNGVLTVNGSASATNFVPWTPLAFFNNAADRMLKTYTTFWSTSYVPTNNGALLAVVNTNFVATFNVTNAFGVTGIPVWVSNRFVYTPAVQRVLQLAANIYDATTNSYYPSVFRPLFTAGTNGNVFITGYTNVPFITDSNQLAQPIDAATLSASSATININNLATNVYGVPWIIGAKKGFPNFNEFQMENVFQLTRKLQLTRPSTAVNFLSNPGAYTISQQLTVSMTNLFGVECWNSYRADHIATNAYVQIVVRDANTMTLTNDEGSRYAIPFSYINATAVSDWPGYGYSQLPNPQSFIYAPLLESEYVAPMIYTFNINFPFVGQAPPFFATNSLMPHWSLLVSNRLQVVMLESNATDNSIHVIDYVQLIGPENSVDLTAAITNLYDTYYNKNNSYLPTANTGYNDMWDPIVNNGMPMGIASQIQVSAQIKPIIYSPYWNGSGWTPGDVTNQTAAFGAFLGFSQLSGASSYIAAGKAALSLQAPYTPTATVACMTMWEVNDPLVHYLASDLAGSSQYTQPQATIIPLNSLTFGGLNDRYRPWGGNVQFPNTSDPIRYDRTIKDPLMYSSDYWNFPTNKMPTTGWLGRVHRGTPWQTVYLKSLDVLGTDGLATWTNWTGNLNYFDAANTAPVQDRLLFDVFTTAFNDNATRGTLSVNVGATPDAHNLAAWSALFSGLVAPTNLAGGYTVIAPAGVYDPTVALTNQPPLVQIAQGIINARAGFINADGLQGVFEHAGNILGTPQLTDLSPFLSGLNPTNQISDELYEWLPQQIMSLLRVGTPRYVIYSYGQALKPAKNGIYLGPVPNPLNLSFGAVTNYQVAAETATRTVVRIETMRTNVNGTVTVTPPRAVVESFNVLPPD
jgi:hypothetical protein